jgi:formate hydrogenlyase subunit 7
MLRLIAYLLKKGIVTNRVIPDLLEDNLIGFPKTTGTPCRTGCDDCLTSCPTSALTASGDQSIIVDRGACINCNLCISSCPTGTLVNDRSTQTFALKREDLLKPSSAGSSSQKVEPGIFESSLAIRVVSTGCSACDLELSAAGNPIFDMERFGVSVVASPRFADALLVTGPVPKAMHAPLLDCYNAMASPKIVIACGTCAVSGGVHKGGSSEANGVSAVLPVDVFIPGCAPHPWQLIRGIQAARTLKGTRFGG